MRILDDVSDKSVVSLTLLLTLSEAREVKNKLDGLINNYGKKGCHEHIDDDDYQHEITISIYNETDILEFHPRIRSLIKNDI